MARIVVGIDGSEHGRRALAWAAEEARLRGATLVVTHVATHPPMTAWALAPPSPTSEELADLGLKLVVEEALAELDIGDLEVERVARVGHPAGVLCDVAEDADLLVLGARGLGGFRGLLLGSTTQQTVTHAPCPVVVVGPDEE